MKKMISILLTLMLVCLSLTACGNKADQEQSNKINSSEEISSNENTDISSEDDTPWGVDENKITEKNDVKARVYIKFPYLTGITKGQGKIAYQNDGSLVILGSESDFEEPTVENGKVENIFPAYFDKVKGTLKLYRQVDYSDYDFEIQNKKVISINDYEMCKYTGIHNFKLNGENKSISFVAYSTKLKSNDAAVYWMVLDDTAEQSLGSTIESHADKMAESLHE